jgi:hypothetical protein
MRVPLIHLSGVWLFAFVSCLQGAEEKPAVAPKSVRKLVADGKHNAFTALVRWKDRYWLAFRSGAGHNSAAADVVVMTSPDGKEWARAFTLDVLPDDRDPQFVATEKRLFLYDNAMKGPELTAHVTFTDDGKTWSKPQPALPARFILWKPFGHAGKFHATMHKKDEASGGKGREVIYITSEDGLKWEPVSKVRGGSWESETTLWPGPGGKMTAFLRQKYGSPPCQVLEAEAPFKEWKPIPTPVNHLSGHCVHTFGGVTYLLSRTIDRSRKTGTMIYVYADGKATPYCELPSGGDCAYPEAVRVGDDMLVSYYSSHEGATNVYLAVVPLKK